MREENGPVGLETEFDYSVLNWAVRDAEKEVMLI